MAVYRELDIGTEKPLDTGRNWQLIDIADPGRDFSVAEFQAAALAVVAAAHRRGSSVLYVGGTGLYHRAVVDGLSFPGRYPDVTAELESLADEPGGLDRLHDRLSSLDPLAASRMERGNRRRLVRALEVTLGSGRTFSSYGPGLASYPDGAGAPGTTGVRFVGLSLERSELDRRLAERLDLALAGGFVAEVERLSARPGGLSRTARQAIGYAELLEVVAGSMPLAEARERILKRLKAFARRQEAWFRRDPRIRWFQSDAPDLVREVLDWWERPMADAARECETEK